MTHLLNEIVTILTLTITVTFLLRKSPRPSSEPETAIVHELVQESDCWAENDIPVEKPSQDYLSLSNTKLRALCKERGIPIPHANAKSALLKVLAENDA